jgi:hypothetical protein
MIGGSNVPPLWPGVTETRLRVSKDADSTAMSIPGPKLSTRRSVPGPLPKSDPPTSPPDPLSLLVSQLDITGVPMTPVGE